MVDPDAPAARLIDVLAEIDFGRRYYTHYEQAVARGKPAPGATVSPAPVLAAASVPFTYHRKEDFYTYLETHGRLELALNVRLRYPRAEFILVFQTPHRALGGPFTRLAREVEERRNPGFTYDPPAPKIPYTTPDELLQTVEFGLALFRDARDAILAADEWDA